MARLVRYHDTVFHHYVLNFAPCLHSGGVQTLCAKITIIVIASGSVVPQMPLNVKDDGTGPNKVQGSKNGCNSAEYFKPLTRGPRCRIQDG